MRQNRLISYLSIHLNNFRHSLSYIDALPQLSILGLAVGLFTGGIIAIFRWLIELPLSQNLVNHASDFESLPALIRVIIIFTGIALLLILLYSFKRQDREMSVGHVIDRVHNHQGNMPFKNWIVQFFGALISIVSGQSVGREGPAVHLGAGAAGQLGKWLKLPNNSMTTLIGCGVASAISTSFNTPLAGVVFAMEVILKEYSIVGFLPIILASVVGAVVGQLIFSHQGDFYFAVSEAYPVAELHYAALLGVAVSIFAASYTKLHIFSLKFNYLPLYQRLIIAGCITSLFSVFVPEIMGLGYDTLNQSIAGELLLSGILVIVIAKTLVTPIIIGLGIPGGLIGPCLMIGALVGAAFSLTLNLMAPTDTDPSLFIIIGMAGMMAAVLNAPLAALIAVLELSSNPSTIFPAMLVIVISCIITRQAFRLDGIFIEQLNHSNRSPDFGPATQALRKAGVRSVMEDHFKFLDQDPSLERLQAALLSKPSWLIFSSGSNMYCVAAADAAHVIEDENILKETSGNIDLLAIPARRYNMSAIEDTADLHQALKKLKNKNSEALYVTRVGPSANIKILGVITLAMIENYYQPTDLLK